MTKTLLRGLEEFVPTKRKDEADQVQEGVEGWDQHEKSLLVSIGQGDGGAGTHTSSSSVFTRSGRVLPIDLWTGDGSWRQGGYNGASRPLKLNKWTRVQVRRA
ncbi:hypothetical protein BKA70DRAFT_1234139 [Coprinopsis sp. MPI-PUGE-AT-0042]|nr:hypothetical protein BKA70DRAFT_1234139 [Coprinopsis sp. MPI-PUGE-AT-0042]